MNLRDELQAIYDAYGTLTPALVVDVATAPDHPLHGRFVWDDAEAARRWREEQAQTMIRSVRIVYRDATETEPARSTRAFVSVPADDGRHAYHPSDVVARDPVMAELARREMQRDWMSLRRRYEEFEEFWQLVAGEVTAKAA